MPLGGRLFRGAALEVPDDSLQAWPAASIAAFNAHELLVRNLSVAVSGSSRKTFYWLAALGVGVGVYIAVAAAHRRDEEFDLSRFGAQVVSRDSYLRSRISPMECLYFTVRLLNGLKLILAWVRKADVRDPSGW